MRDNFFSVPLKISNNNFRTGKHGYTWGVHAQNSYILKTLGLTNKDLGIEPDEPVAEWWVVSDDVRFPSEVELKDGKVVSLTNILHEYPTEILGEKHFQKYGAYLGSILKLIDPAFSLSVQVHPAIGHPSRPPKPEVWLIESSIAPLYLGFNQNLSGKKLEKIFQDGTLESYLYEYMAKKGERICVDGGLVHAIRGGSTLWEWSYAPTKNDSKCGDIKKATVSLWDRTDGKNPRKGKEDINGSLDVLSDAHLRCNKNVYKLLSVPSVVSESIKLYSDGSGNEIIQMFKTLELVINELKVLSLIHLNDFEQGFQMFVKSGSVDVCDVSGKVLISLKKNDAVLVPASLKNICIKNKGQLFSKIFVWNAVL